MTQFRNAGGYRHVSIRGRSRAGHRMVLETFVGLAPEGMECCHRDNDREHNHRHNLRWDTRAGNRADRHYWRKMAEPHWTTCVGGHEVWNPNRGAFALADGHPLCLECVRERNRLPW